MKQNETWDKVKFLREERVELKKTLLTKKVELTEALNKVDEMLKDLDLSLL